MRRSRLYCDQVLNVGDEVTLDAVTSHHLCTVLRAHQGSIVLLFNNREDAEYEAELIKPHKKNACVRLTQRVECFRESSLYIHLYQGVSRGDRMDFAIQKATEMGAHEITPVLCERSQIKLSGERGEKKRAHWQQIIISACQQSGRCRLAKLNAVQHFQEALLQRDAQSVGLFLDTQTSQSGDAALRQAQRVDLWIGPEGGFDPTEVQAAQDQGLASVSLGPRILRTETAAIAALTYCQLISGDIH
ncbi:conserved hypothetical protein TIGR00046 [gamma proteobacterium HTCC5015]|nr:conserved hypothetical protein TIGR00046 [gamma proteobacterium HTCC5015]